MNISSRRFKRTTRALECADGWTLAGVCIPSSRHERTGSPCQDQLDIRIERDVHVLALADGAGSRARSHIGARIAVVETCRELVGAFDQFFADEKMIAPRLISRITREITRAARRYKVTKNELACTIAFIAIRGSCFIAGNVGDGLVACMGTQTHRVLLAPNRGEFAHQTYFVTDDWVLDNVHVVVGRLAREDIGFFLMSDGATGALYDSQQSMLAPNGVKIGNWLRAEKGETVLRELEGVARETLSPRSRDDCTLALVTRTPTASSESTSRAPTHSEADQRPDKSLL